jgi:putative glutamine amidotransferase
MTAPLIGMTTDFDGERQFVRPAYAAAIERAGGVPVLLPIELRAVEGLVNALDGFVLSGGDDPIMERWGVSTHPQATTVHPDRQAFELALLDALRDRAPDKPVLGVCLGMQYMALHAGGAMDQHLPATDPRRAARHWGRQSHRVSLTLDGVRIEADVLSHHRQVITDPGTLHACATSDDGLIEGVIDQSRRFYIGVQWHPERTDAAAAGSCLFNRLVEACRGVRPPTGRPSRAHTPSSR